MRRKRRRRRRSGIRNNARISEKQQAHQNIKICKFMLVVS
jgi:hypothetical protein